MPLYSNAPRCQHLKVDGTQCGSPALRRNRFCFFHKRFQEERISISRDRVRRGRATLILPVLEDANSIQVSLMQIMRLLAAGQIDARNAGLMLYALQTASFNLRWVRFEPLDIQHVVIDRDTVDQTGIGGKQWYEEDFPDPELTEEEKAAAAAEEQARVAAARRAKEQEKARRRAELQAEAEQLMREGAEEERREAQREAQIEAARKANDALASKNAALANSAVTEKKGAVVAGAGSMVSTVTSAAATSVASVNKVVVNGSGAAAVHKNIIAQPSTAKGNIAAAGGKAPASPALPPPRPPASVPRIITAEQAARVVVNAMKNSPPMPAPTRRSGLKKGSRGRRNVDIDMDQVRQEVQGLARAFVMDTLKHVSQRRPPGR
ncbi:MAG: hypothetical protein WBQ08_11860 [Candidatus Sulfotelmatobacter sp.]